VKPLDFTRPKKSDPAAERARPGILPWLDWVLRTPLRLFLVYNACFWLVYFVFRSVLGGVVIDQSWQIFAVRGAASASGFILSCAIVVCLSRLPHGRTALKVGAGLILCVLGSIAFVYVDVGFQTMLGFPSRPLDLPTVTRWSASILWIFTTWLALYAGLSALMQVQEERRMASEARALAREASLRMLRYQLNPHFLFNTLNALSTLVLEDEKRQAGAMITKLSRFLRYTLDSELSSTVPLAREMEAQRLYLDIEGVRFEDRLTIEMDIAEDVHAAEVPSLLIQPLIENAIKHGAAPKREGGRIDISAHRENDDLVLTIGDTGPGVAEPVLSNLRRTGGVGVPNTIDRLKQLYGPRGRLTARNRTPTGLLIEIRLPFREDLP